MMDAATSPARLKMKPFIMLVIGLSFILLVAANVHLLYVAVTSQPECVDHVRRGDERNNSFSAAKSSCSPKAARPTKLSAE
ncbi:MAG: hypothetical protein ACRC9K_13605 [Afipia sp.]